MSPSCCQQCDLLQTPLNKDELKSFCEANDFLTWFETSAKKSTGIEEGCRYLVDFVLKNDLKPAREESNLLKMGPDADSRAMEEREMCFC